MSEYKLLFILIFFSCFAIAAALLPFRQHKKVQFLMMCILTGLVCGSYWLWGGWALLRDHQQQLANQARVQAMLKTVKGPDDLIQRLKNHLKKEPSSAKGWYLLGRLYASQNQQKLAKDAFTKAYQLDPQDESYIVNYAKSLFDEAKGRARACRLLSDLLQTNPEQPDALAMLALDAYMRHQYQQAMDYWQRLLELLPPNSKEAASVRQAIAQCIN